MEDPFAVSDRPRPAKPKPKPKPETPEEHHARRAQESADKARRRALAAAAEISMRPRLWECSSCGQIADRDPSPIAPTGCRFCYGHAFTPF